jgi:mono/diheme cytochrome c family protein
MKILHLIGKVFLGLIGLILFFVLYIQFGYNVKYDRPYPEVQASTDSTVIARGEYLVRGPAHCEGCHSHPDDQDELKAGKKVPLRGGRTFDTPLGKIYPKNLTPDEETGIGGKTDGELARLLRYAVDSKGHSIIPFFMPFSNMSEDDLSAILSYLRAQEPVRNEVPASSYSLMGKALKRLLISPSTPDPLIDKNIQPDSTIAYGRYLAYGVANCIGCHTTFSMKEMNFDGPHFSGGTLMDEGGEYIFSTPNLTPDPKTGHIANWSEQQFVERFKKGRIYEGSPMSWEFFARMTERDMKAIYRFLQSLDPVENDVGDIVREKDQLAQK